MIKMIAIYSRAIYKEVIDMKYYEKPELSIKLFIAEDIVRTSLGDNEEPWGWEGLDTNAVFE